jgi:hypothetical protein
MGSDDVRFKQGSSAGSGNMLLAVEAVIGECGPKRRPTEWITQGPLSNYVCQMMFISVNYTILICYLAIHQGVANTLCTKTCSALTWEELRDTRLTLLGLLLCRLGP